MWTPFVGEITTTIRDPDNASDRYAEYRCVHAAHYAALALGGIYTTCNFLILRHFYA